MTDDLPFESGEPSQDHVLHEFAFRGKVILYVLNESRERRIISAPNRPI